MSNTDSFIDEVSEEVRKDQLFGYMRKYGWIAVLVVLLLVGGTAFSEYRKAQAEASARSAGNAILSALEIDDDAARAQALQAVEAEDGAAVVTGLLAAADLVETGETAAAAETLNTVALQEDAPQVYRDLAALKAAMIADGPLSDDDRRATFERLSAPGSTFRLVALEQLALMNVAAGETELALDQFGAIAQDAEVTGGLRDRAIGMIVALDGDIESLIFGIIEETDQ